MTELKLLHEIASPISEWEKFSRILGIEEYFILQTDRDKRSCYEKAYACIYQKYMTSKVELSWSFWKEQLFKLGDEGKYVITHLETSFPELFALEDKDSQSHQHIDHMQSKGQEGGIIGHNDEGVNIFSIMDAEPVDYVKVCVGAGEFKMYDYKNLEEWEELKDVYSSRFDLINKNSSYDFLSFSNNKRCKILDTLSKWLKENGDKGFAINGYNIYKQFDLLRQTHSIKDHKNDSYILMYCQKANVMLHIETAPKNLHISWKNNLNRIRMLRSLNPWMTNESVIHIPLILLNGSLKMFQENSSCEDCITLKLITVIEDFQDLSRFNTWWMDMLTHINQMKEKMSEKKVDTLYITKKLLSSIITFMALTNFPLPTFTNNLEQQMEESKKLLMLTPEQIAIIYSEHNHMIIDGSYGSGKSIAAQKRFEKVVETEPNEALFYCICHDQDSAFVREMKKIPTKMRNKNIKVFSSFELIGEDYKLSSILSQLLDTNKNETIHLFIEEFNGEVIDEEEIQTIIPLLEKSFSNSHIILVAQSIQCKRLKISSDSVPYLKYQYEKLEAKTSFKTFNLTHIMRSSNNIKKLIDVAIPIIESDKIKSILPKIVKKIPSSQTKLKKNSIHTISKKTGETLIVPSGSNLDSSKLNEVASASEKPKISKQKAVNNDETLKIFSENKSKYEAYAVIESQFKFNGERNKGHNIDGPLPEIYFPFPSKNEPFLYQTFFLTLILNKILNSRRKFVIIYFNKECYDYLYTALTAMQKEFTTCPNEFSKDQYTIWLAKYTSVRGCEFSDVILAFPLHEQYLKQNIISGLSRCTMNLKILVFDYNRSPIDSALREILEKWLNGKFATCYKLFERGFFSFLNDERFYLAPWRSYKVQYKEEGLAKRNNPSVFMKKHNKLKVLFTAHSENDVNDPDILLKMGLETKPKSLNKASFNALCNACVYAERKDDIRILKNALYAEDADINSTYNGDTFLHYFLQPCNIDRYRDKWLDFNDKPKFIRIIEMLIYQADIGINIKDAKGKTALDLARDLAVTYDKKDILNSQLQTIMNQNLTTTQGTTKSASEQMQRFLDDKMKNEDANAIQQQQEVENKAAAEVMEQRMLQNCNVEDDDLYGDGDQSPLKGMEAQKLRTQWASGMGFHPNNLSTFYTFCYVGDTERVNEMLKQSSDKQKLIEKRETLFRFSALFCVVQGAKASVHAVNDNKKCNSLAVMKLLIKEGANVNARDIAGYSVLFHCFAAFGNQEEKLKLGKELLNAGADVNLPNRFGCTSLHENVMTHNFEILDFLVEHGADPSVKDNDGIAPIGMAALIPAAQKIFSKAGFIPGREKQEEANSSEELGKCFNCDKAGAKNRCSQCLIAHYCNRDCQRVHWKKHKKECCEKEKLKVKVDTTVPSKDGKNLNYSSINFKVKVQVHKSNMLGTEKSCLYVYDNRRSFQRFIQPSDPSYDGIVEKIRVDGVMQRKGYFYAYLDKNHQLFIQLDNMLPPESW